LLFRLLLARTNHPYGENFADSKVRSRREDEVGALNQKRPQILDRSQNRLGTRWYFERVHYGIQLPAINAQ
jgi:chorismate-pyruvate lyase